MERLLEADIGFDRLITCAVTKRVKKPGQLPLESLTRDTDKTASS